MDEIDRIDGTEEPQVNPLDEPARALADYLYKRTALSKVTSKKPLLVSPPFGIAKEDMAALLGTLGTEAAHPALANTAWVQGKKDFYYYDGSIMTKQYAALDALLEDKDILATIATVTRSDSKLYPRPTQFTKLMTMPFRFTKDEILGAVARMKNEEQYQDIGVVTASNGASALFSSEHISRGYAQALIERIEVEDPANP